MHDLLIHSSAQCVWHCRELRIAIRKKKQFNFFLYAISAFRGNYNMNITFDFYLRNMLIRCVLLMLEGVIVLWHNKSWQKPTTRKNVIQLKGKEIGELLAVIQHRSYHCWLLDVKYRIETNTFKLQCISSQILEARRHQCNMKVIRNAILCRNEHFWVCVCVVSSNKVVASVRFAKEAAKRVKVE